MRSGGLKSPTTPLQIHTARSFESNNDSIVITGSGRLTRSSGIKVGDDIEIKVHHSISGLEGKTGKVTRVWTNNKTRKKWIKVKLHLTGKVVNTMIENCVRFEPEEDDIVSPPSGNKESRGILTPPALSRIAESNGGHAPSDAKTRNSKSSFSFLAPFDPPSPIGSPYRKPRARAKPKTAAESSLSESLAAISMTPRIANSNTSLDWSDGSSDSSSYEMEDDGRYQPGRPPPVAETSTPIYPQSPSSIMSGARMVKVTVKDRLGLSEKGGHSSTIASSQNTYNSSFGKDNKTRALLGAYYRSSNFTPNVVKYKRKRKKYVNQYEVRKSLGEGSFGFVRLGFDMTCSRLVAIKKMNKSRLRKDLGTSSQSQLSKVRAGLSAASMLSHRNVLKVLEIMDSRQLDTLYVVLEYAEYGQIMEFDLNRKTYHPLMLGVGPLGGIKLVEVKNLLRQAIEAIRYMHSVKVTHGDIKPDNLLLNSKLVLKLSDFGSCRSHTGDHEPPSADGTYAFWSPEMASNSSASSDSFDDDVWALGVTLYCMAFGDPPFYELNPIELFGLITRVQIKPPKRIPDRPTHPDVKELCALLAGALLLDRSRRFKLEKIAKHPFLKNQTKPKSVEIARTMSSPNAQLRPKTREIKDSARDSKR